MMISSVAASKPSSATGSLLLIGELAMALAPLDSFDSLTMTTLDASHRAALRALLERDLDHNLFALSWLENYGVASSRRDVFHFRGLIEPRRGQLMAMALVISDRLILLEAPDPEHAALFGRWYCEAAFRFQHVVSAEAFVAPFWSAYTSSSRYTAQPPYRARLIAEQRLYSLSRARWSAARAEIDAPARARRLTSITPPQIPMALREATLAELDAVFLASASMHREETGEDPLLAQPALFRQHVRHRIQTGRTYVWFDAHRRLIFKADLSAQSRYGVQISGVYTDPTQRNQGVATRAMTELCRIVFVRGWPRATLYVNRTNAAAIKVYERIGFEPRQDYMTVFVEQP